MKNTYPIIMQKENGKYSQILSNVKESYQSTDERSQIITCDIPPNFTDISKSVTKTMQSVVSTQRTFELKKRCEENEQLGKAFSMYSQVMNLFGFKRKTGWSELFETQLNNVNELNGYLAKLVMNSGLQSKKLQLQLIKTIDNAKLYNDKRQEAIEIIPIANEDYKKGRDDLKKMEDSDPKYYEALKKDFDSENKLMIHISELNIVKSAHEKDLQTIEVLKKHFAFHRGLTFSAKSLAIKTAQICSSLEHLIGAYEPIQSMGYCLEAIHGGISNLQGYTDALNETYKNTFRIMTQTENSDDYHIMSLNSNQLEDVVGRMMDNLDERLAQ